MQLRDAVPTLLALMPSLASAALSVCPPNANGVCYSVGVPRSSAAKGSGNIYMQIRAPASYQWVALGTGRGMAGSNIFLVYQDGNGNMTVSPRRGKPYSMPTLDTSSTAARLTLLSGSGVSTDGKTMTANLACSNCESWSGGSMGLADAKAGWIGAWKAGGSLATTDAGTAIQQHDNTAVFGLDLRQAAIESDSNPFVDAGAPAGTPGTDSGNSSDNNGVTFVSVNNDILIAHATIMALLFVLLYPLASMAMPLLGKWKVHGGAQVFNFVLMWVGFGLGIQTAKDRNMLFTNPHTILGTVVVCLLFIQPFLGYAHHMHYVKYQRRGIVSYVHMFWGQSLMVLGLVNGGLGLQLAGAPNSWIIAYAVVAAAIFLLYAIVKVSTMFKGRRNSRETRKEAGSPGSPAHQRPYP